MDDALERVRAAMNLDLHEDDVDKIPEGWRGIYTSFRDAVTLLGGQISKVKYDKGVLHVTTTPTIEKFADPIKWMEQGLAKRSSRKCMIDPDLPGFRRKAYDGWPTLSWQVLIPYANQLDEEEQNAINDRGQSSEAGN